jgi:hypothetical protein
VETWCRRSYLPRRTRISILLMVKLEILRSRVTGTCVRTLATLTACEETGRVMVASAPVVTVARALEVASDRALVVASVMAVEVESARAGRVAIGDWIGGG